MPAPNDPTRSLPPGHAEGSTREYNPELTAGVPTPTASTLGFSAPAGPTTAPASPERYILKEELARGGMGIVYLATDTVLGRETAVKTLQAKYAAGSEAARRFLAEAKITGRLQHPAIPPVHDLGTLPDGRPFLAMKLIRGRTLADELADRTDPAHDQGRFVAAFAQVCQAVAYAHAHGFIHRDVKPLNVMIGAFGEVQVMDWGLAKELGADRATSESAALPRGGDQRAGPNAPKALAGKDDLAEQTRAGQVMGTPGYMPPEQARGDGPAVDQRADVFALGAILCEVLTGKPPYGRDSADVVLARAVAGALVPAFEQLDACGAAADLVALCKRSLSANRGDRPADAGAVAAAVAASQVAAEERARRAEVERARIEEQRKRRRVQWALAGAVVLLLAVVGFGAALASLWRTAEANRVEAVEARAVAEQAQVAEAQARQQVEWEREKLAVFEYGGTMRVAHQKWRDGNFVAMRAMLDGSDPELRNWEWRYLNRLSDPSLLTLNSHALAVNATNFNADGSRVVTGGHDKTAKMWDAGTGVELLSFRGHTRPVSSAVFSADGTRVVTGSWDQTARVWDAKTGVELLALRGHVGGVTSAAFSADGTRIATGSRDGTARVWDAKTGAEALALTGHTGAVFAANFSPDGTRIVTGNGEFGRPGEARVWEAKTGAEVLTLRGHMGEVFAANFSPDGSRVVTGSSDGTAKVWDAKTGGSLILKGHAGGVWSSAFSPDGSRVVTGSSDQTAWVWDAKTGAEVLTIRGHASGVSAAGFSPDGLWIVTGSWDQTARVWDAKTGAEVLTLTGHTNTVSSVSFSADGTRVVTGSLDQTARVWDARPFAESRLPDPLPVAPMPRRK